MQVVLTAELEDLVKEEVASGSYQSPQEVIRDALQLLRERGEKKLEALQRDIQVGLDQLDQGEYDEYDEGNIRELAEDIKARGIQRLEARSRMTSR